MILRYLTSIIIALFIPALVSAQQETYTIKLAPFSSQKYDEFSPVFYKNGIVFCTNRNNNLTNYSTSQNKGLFKINIIDTSGKVKWQDARLFSKSLTTNLNDGPVTFNSTGDTIYFSRNLEVSGKSGNISSPRNKLGIFTAVFDGKDWIKIRELRINNEWYNMTTPCLSPDGKRLYFASDKPGGFGGSDLYYCQWKGDYWNDPVNLGPVINTKGNEAYPFINPAGELFFSSDDHPGLGKKDIFFSRYEGNDWLPPVHLDPPINSQYDDFGIITDTLMKEGYFSSNRNKTIDIYSFKTNFPQIFYTNVQKDNHYCFTFRDSGRISVDTLNLKYMWNFGDGEKASGAVVKHCYPGSGKYNVKLDIVERSTGNLYFSKLAYTLDLKNYVQPYINSEVAAVKGDMIDFDGLKSYYPGYQILDFFWDFGDGTRLKGESVKHAYKEKGEYLVNLGLSLRDSTGIVHKTGVTRKISVFNTPQDKSAFQTGGSSLKPAWPDIREYRNAVIATQFSAENEFSKEAVFQVEVLSSKTKIGINSYLFRNVPKKYTVVENYNEDSGLYSYIIDQQMNLMATHLAFKGISGLGFKDVKVILEILRDPAAKELNSLKKIFGVSTDSYFDDNNRLTSNAYLMLDQVVKILNKYPGIKLNVGVHTDNTGLPDIKLGLSQNYAQIIVTYLINKGMDTRRLVARGYGGTRPVASNYLEKERVMNRRVDFSVIKE